MARYIGKNPTKYFANGVHPEYGCEGITQSIKKSLVDVYDRILSQSFELLDGCVKESGPYNLVLKIKLPVARSLIK